MAVGQRRGLDREWSGAPIPGDVPGRLPRRGPQLGGASSRPRPQRRPVDSQLSPRKGRRFRVTYTHRDDFPDGDLSLTELRADLACKDGPPIPGSLHEKGSKWETARRAYGQIGDVLRKGVPFTSHRRESCLYRSACGARTRAPADKRRRGAGAWQNRRAWGTLEPGSCCRLDCVTVSRP